MVSNTLPLLSCGLLCLHTVLAQFALPFSWERSADAEIGVPNWGKTWANCDKDAQSPINFIRADAQQTCNMPLLSETGEFTLYPGDCNTGELETGINAQNWEVGYQFARQCRKPYVAVGDKIYDLVQFHFHSQSEHEIDGELADLEIHMVHRSDQKFLDLMVLAVRFNVDPEAPHRSNTELAKYWDNFVGDRVRITNEFRSNPYLILPENPRINYYQGSLTTPPCFEVVTWVIMDEVLSISQGQLDQFRKLRKGAPNQWRLSEDQHSNRPVQPLNGRDTYSCDATWVLGDRIYKPSISAASSSYVTSFTTTLACAVLSALTLSIM